MRRYALLVLTAFVLAASAGIALAASKTWTFDPPTITGGWTDVHIAPAVDANPSAPGDQPGACATITACGRASDGTLGDCSSTTRCAVNASVPASVVNLVTFLLGQWTAEHGY